jgi:uncharacterized protein
MTATLWQNLCSPLCLAFGIGIAARVVKSELSLPKELYASLSIYLLFALGLKGGVELSHTSLTDFLMPAVVTIGLGLLTPITAFIVLWKLCRFNVSDAAGIAAHYGSVSAVTFIAAQQFVANMNHPAEGFMPTLLTLLEIPGIQVALAIGAILTARESSQKVRANDEDRQETKARSLKSIMHEILTSRSMVLLVGGLAAGCLMGDVGYKPVKPFFEDLFKGALTLFLLEMGLAAGSRLKDLFRVGPILIVFGTVMPLVHGTIGALLGAWSGLSVGGTAVLATMAASASYIAAPPAVRMSLPQANPTYYLTAALAITFPFNLVFGIPIYLMIAQWACS